MSTLLEELSRFQFTEFLGNFRQEKLFEAALERYNQVQVTIVFAFIKDPKAGADAIRTAVSDWALKGISTFAGRGC